jgi:hypothetical protein
VSHFASRLVLGAGLFLSLLLWQAASPGPGQDVPKNGDKKEAVKDKAGDKKDAAKDVEKKDKDVEKKEAPKDVEKKEAPKEAEKKEAPKEEKEAPKEEKEAPKGGEAAQEDMKRLLEKAREEYRLYFKKPETVPQFWSAITFEMDVGKFDVAALLLDKLLKKEPAADVDKGLAQLEEARGMSTFLRLLNVRKWHENPDLDRQFKDNVQALIRRATTAVESRLSDPVRLRKLIASLGAPTPEERKYASVHLQRAGPRATPYLVDELQRTAGKPEQERIKDMLLRLDGSALLPLFEALRARTPQDAKNVEFRLALLDVLKARDDRRAIPYLWHLAAAPRYPDPVRRRALETLASLLGSDVSHLPPAKAALTELAERYEHHQVKFADPKRVLVWPWNGQELARQPVLLAAGQAEQYYGLVFADEALDLDPTYRPAQEVFLALTLERTFAQALDQVMQKKLPDSVHRLLAALDTDLLLRTLERALTERDVAVILPLVRILGERGESRAALPSGDGRPRGLLRALYYPDRRVQMAAARAVLRLPGTPEPATSARVVDILRRFVAAEPAPVALAAFVPQDQAHAVRKALKGAGFEAVLTPTAKDMLSRLEAGADVDIILIHHAVLPAELPYLLGQLRADSNAGLLPVVLLSSPDTKERFTQLARRYPNVWVVPEGLAALPDAMKARLEESIKLAQAPADVGRLPPYQRSWVVADINRTQGLKLSEPERILFAKEAMGYLEKMALGTLRGYELRPAKGAVEKVVRSDKLGPQAIKILGRLPGVEPQQRLALLATDPSAGDLRLPAAVELNRQIRRSGLLLTKQQLADIRREYNNLKVPAELRAEFALVLGQLGSGSRLTGQRLRNYRPDEEAPPPPPPQKKE